MSGFFFFQAEDGIRDLVRSRGLGDVYKRQPVRRAAADSLARGETFYSHNLGLPELREAIAAYTLSLIHI